MEEEIKKTTIRRSVMKWGVIAALVSFGCFMILNMTIGLWSKYFYPPINAICIIVILVLAHKAYKEEGNGFMSFDKGFKIGFLISTISVIILSLLKYIYTKFVNDPLLEIRDEILLRMQEDGASDDRIAHSMWEFGRYLSPESVLIQDIFIGIIIGCICALVVTAFTQKKG